MKKSRLMPLMLVFLSIGILASISVVYAPWQTLGTGYAITTNYHGIDVLPGTHVTATAGTLDPSIVSVTFKWNAPNGTTIWIDVVTPLWTNGTYGKWNDGTTALIHYANATHTLYLLEGLSVPQDWGVQAFFQGPGGKEKANVADVIKIKAESFNVIPEVPLGTIAVTLSMFTALGIFALKKKRIKFHS